MVENLPLTEYILYDIDTQLRALRAEIYNLTRGENASPITEVEPLPLTVDEQEQRLAGDDERSPERIKFEQDHLLSVLNRPNPH